MTQVAFDTLDFANKLKAAGLAPKIAETQAELQAELQNSLVTRIDEQQAILNELTKHELATKEDINMLECKLEAKISMVESKLLVRLSGTMVGCTALLGTLATFLRFTH